MKHNSAAPLRSIAPIRRTLSAISIALSLVFALAAFGVSVNTSWTYQGQLRRSGAAYNGTCNFQFSLWNALSSGAQQGTQSINSVNVVNGLFTVVLDFGAAFTGEARWLATSVQCSGDPGFTPLDPRQPITATPYALSLRPGARIEGSISAEPPDDLSMLRVNNAHSAGIAVWGSSGSVGLLGESTGAFGKGVWGLGSGADSVGVYGTNDNGPGLSGHSTGPGSAVHGENVSTGRAGEFLSTGQGSAVYGENTGGGYAGQFAGPVNIAGPLTATNTSSSGIGVDSSSFIGVHGKTTAAGGSGVYGEALLGNSAGVFGTNRDSAAIWGRTTGNGSAIYGERSGSAAGYAGYFLGPVHVQGALTKLSGTFKIDHPLDPANKFLSHSFVESPDMMNIYNGNVTTDASGSATVTLPSYFAALNRDFRYQLTVVGQFAQAIVSRKIAGNTFEIRTDKPGVEVSWLVMGNRQDAYAKEHPIVVEEFKPAEQKGLYLYPAGFGAGEEKGIGYSSRPTTAPGAQETPATGSSDQASK